MVFIKIKNKMRGSATLITAILRISETLTSVTKKEKGIKNIQRGNEKSNCLQECMVQKIPKNQQ